MRTELVHLRLNQITHDVSLTPEAHEIDESGPNPERIRQYFRLQEDFSFAGCPLVWRTIDGKHLLAANYDLLISLRQFFFRKPETSVPCTVLHDATKAEVLEFSHRAMLIANIDIGNKKTKPHFRRLLPIVSYLDASPSATFEDLKRFFNLIGKARTPLAEQLRKDFHLARSSTAMCGILGVKSLKTEDLKPNLAKAIYTLDFAANYLIPGFKLTDPDDIEAQERFVQFDQELRQYIEEEVISGRRLKKDLAKPMYQQCNEKRVAAIFEKWSGKKLPQKQSKQSKISNSRWTIDSSAGEIKIGEFAYDKSYLDRENAKKHVDATYRLLIIYQAEQSFLRRAGPVNHGEDFRKKDEFVNNPEFEAFRYFQFIRAYKVLKFCDPYLLLRSIDLRPSWFGFESSNLLAESNYALASEKFEEWWTTKFLPQAQPEFTDITRHRHYEIYHTIKVFLGTNSVRPETICLDDFIQRLFAYVFRRLDDLQEVERKEEQAIRLLLGDASVEERTRILNGLLKSKWNVAVNTRDSNELELSFGSPAKEPIHDDSEAH
ncbi:MAG: hypothetical protein KF681_15825 [Bdellovibrionaceae bacterium]|nr:hypothetical protein [Pseudobdellovibrionaceae bacterium]